MKRAILPVGLAIVLNIIIMIVNPDVELVGNLLAGFVGVGIGVALNNLIFKTKKNIKKEETEI